MFVDRSIVELLHRILLLILCKVFVIDRDRESIVRLFVENVDKISSITNVRVRFVRLFDVVEDFLVEFVRDVESFDKDPFVNEFYRFVNREDDDLTSRSFLLTIVESKREFDRISSPNPKKTNN